MRRLGRFTPLLLIYALLAGMLDCPVLASTVASIHGIVRNASSAQPIPDALITLSSSSARYESTTDARGFYSIVGIRPDSYALAVRHDGYQSSEQPVSLAQDSSIKIDVTLAPEAMKTIAVVSTHSAVYPVQPNQPNDVYVVRSREIAQLGGVPAFENESLTLNALPGVSQVGGPSGGGYLGNGTSIRGGLANNPGYQLDGINATEPITGFFINNLVLNGEQNVNLTVGPGDASKGGSGSGYVNIVSKVGTYPATGFAQFEIGGPAFEHNAEFEYGAATPNQRFSGFVSGRYGRDFGGCCAPPYGNTYGGHFTSYPDTVGQVQFESTNDTLANLLYHFGRDNANTFQLWGEIGANQETGGYGIDPTSYPFPSANPAYVSVYQQAPLFLNPQATPLSYQQAQALMPLFPTQSDVNQAIGALPHETTEYYLLKLGYSRNVSSRRYLSARLYRTQNAVVDSFADPSNVVFAYGLPSLGFSDTYVTRASQNTGLAADIQQQIGERHSVIYGFDYRFSRAALDGFLPSSSLFFAGPTIGDFMPGTNPLTGQPAQFAGQRYPAVNFLISDPMHQTAFYLSDNWTMNDRVIIQPGVRYDLQTVPTAAGRYEANQLQPRIFGTWSLGTQRATVLRGGYGHATTFAPLFQIENIYNPPTSFHQFPATLPICGGTTASFSAPCKDYYDELYNAWWKGYGVNPYAFSGPQQSDSYDLSVEHSFPHQTGLKLTFFSRHDYGVIVNSQQVTISQGVVIPGTVRVTNEGRAQTTGVELQVSRQIVDGLSAQVNATYLNQFVNYITSNAFRPAVEPALLASGTLFHPSYVSPFSATITLDYQKSGWRFDPILQYIRGFPIGTWANDPIFLNGVPFFVPNTNLYGNFGSQYCYYVDPQTPGTPQNPNIVGATGGGCTASLNGALTSPVLYTNLAISHDFVHRITLGLEIQNLFNNYANYPYNTPGYVNNGFGVSGPGSGANPVAGFPGAISAYPPGPFFAVPSGHGRQFTVFSRFLL
jgi:hypothetical protein